MSRVSDESPASPASSDDRSTSETDASPHASAGSRERERASAPGNVRLVVFDFDLTILRIHSWGERVRPEDVEHRHLDRDVADLAFFRAFVLALRDAGVRVAVASFGQYEVIQRYMDAVFGDGQSVFKRANVSTPSTVGFRDGTSVPGGKVPQLCALVSEQLFDGTAQNELDEEVWRAATSAVAFFDDDVKNVDGAKRAGYARAALVDGDVGFTRESWEGGLRSAVGMGSFEVPEVRSASPVSAAETCGRS